MKLVSILSFFLLVFSSSSFAADNVPLKAKCGQQYCEVFQTYDYMDEVEGCDFSTATSVFESNEEFRVLYVDTYGSYVEVAKLGSDQPVGYMKMDDISVIGACKK